MQCGWDEASKSLGPMRWFAEAATLRLTASQTCQNVSGSYMPHQSCMSSYVLGQCVLLTFYSIESSERWFMCRCLRGGASVPRLPLMTRQCKYKLQLESLAWRSQGESCCSAVLVLAERVLPVLRQPELRASACMYLASALQIWTEKNVKNQIEHHAGPFRRAPATAPPRTAHICKQEQAQAAAPGQQHNWVVDGATMSGRDLHQVRSQEGEGSPTPTRTGAGGCTPQMRHVHQAGTT